MTPTRVVDITGKPIDNPAVFPVQEVDVDSMTFCEPPLETVGGSIVTEHMFAYNVGSN